METQIFHITSFVSTAGITHFCKTLAFILLTRISGVNLISKLHSSQTCFLLHLEYFTLMLTKTIFDLKF